MSDNRTPTFDPDWCMRPGVHLQEMMDDSGLTGAVGVRMVAKLSGLTVEQVEGILSGKTKITPRIAAQLGCGTGALRVSPQMWLNLERTYRKALKAGKKDVSDE